MTPLEQKIGEWYGENWRSALCDRIASGEFVTTLAHEIQERVKREGLALACSRTVVSRLLNATEEDKALVREAREEAGHALAEQTIQVALDAPNERDAVSAAALKHKALA